MIPSTHVVAVGEALEHTPVAEGIQGVEGILVADSPVGEDTAGDAEGTVEGNLQHKHASV